MFAIDMLPAEHGDCVWIEYGPADNPRRILIDGGTSGTFRTLRTGIAALPAAQRRFELLVVSHIDADHIGGAIELLEGTALGVSFGDIWFNGHRHLLVPEGTRGVAQDTAEANGSSVALLAEHDGKRALLTGDAFPGVLMEAFERLFADRGTEPLRLDAMKVSHHGSRANTTWPLLYRVARERFLFSTDGSVFDHPDDECVARVVAHGGPSSTLCFNYRSARTEAWADPARARALDYTAVYPADGCEGLRVEL